MYWQIPVLCHVILAYMIAPVLIKKIATAPSRTRSLMWQYIFSSFFALIVGLITDAQLFDQRLIIVVLLGFCNAFACYCHWRAVDISLSRTSLFSQADDLICLFLGYIVLHETRILNPILALGLFLSCGSVCLFTIVHARSTAVQNLTDHKRWRLGVWVGLYSVIWGVAIFSLRYFSLQNMRMSSYITAWYSGCLFGTFFVRWLAGKKEAGEPLKFSQIIGIIPLSLTICLALMSMYWSKTLAPITVAQPIFQVSEMIFPTLIGLWIFKEKKHLENLSLIAMILGLAGGMLLVLNF